jgi:hypothetical protein
MKLGTKVTAKWSFKDFGVGKIVATKDWIDGHYLVKFDAVESGLGFENILTYLNGVEYYDCESTIKGSFFIEDLFLEECTIHDSKLARNLYKNQIDKIEDGLIYLKRSI